MLVLVLGACGAASLWIHQTTWRASLRQRGFLWQIVEKQGAQGTRPGFIGSRREMRMHFHRFFWYTEDRRTNV